MALLAEMFVLAAPANSAISNKINQKTNIP
jgi:hypothetical protein